MNHKTARHFILASLVLVKAVLCANAVEPQGGVDLKEIYKDFALVAAKYPDRLRDTHIELASEPHVAGTPGDARTIERISKHFRDAGLEVELHEIYPLLSRPIEASLTITSPVRIELPLVERGFPQEDPDSANPDIGWNAYAASGDVEAQVVYVNYGTKGDFERLGELGVSCKGKIVLARYGGNYRGYKVKFAQEAGALGVIIFTDPGDSGFVQGSVYPEGGYASECCIQRGSVLTLGYQGDPLTPGVEATLNAQRLKEEQTLMPRIACQPIGYVAAREMLKRMTGVKAPKEWQGGLGFEYALTCEQLKVRLVVKQVREVTKTANVLARLIGSEFPDEQVIIGAHHDAWNHGAADPLCGTIAVIESAKIFAELAKQGIRPKRTLVFAAWGAEEFGIIGSSEWVEKERKALIANGVAYINLDMASMGPQFGASALPSMRGSIVRAAAVVPQARNPSQTVLEEWTARSPDPARLGWPQIGDIGGGSDHVGFLCHAGVASAGFGSGGSRGTSYHSAYDTLRWYWKVVGGDYEPARMIMNMASMTAADLAFGSAATLDPCEYRWDLMKQLKALSALGQERGVFEKANPSPQATDDLDIHADFRPILQAAEELCAAATGLTQKNAASTLKLLAVDRAFVDEEGLKTRTWFKSVYAAPDEDSGYAPWPLPRIRRAIEVKDEKALREGIADLTSRLQQATAGLKTTPN